MKPGGHIIISFSVSAAIWLFTKSLSNTLICFLVGFLLDIDHLIDYLLEYNLKGFSFKRCYRSFENAFEKEEYPLKKLYLFFHGIEFSLILWFLAVYTKRYGLRF